MRSKVNYQKTFNYKPSINVKVVRDYVTKYKRIDEILQENREIWDVVHADFRNCLSCSNKGRDGDYTIEEIFRAILVLFLEQWSFQKTIVNIDTNIVLQEFVGLGFKPMMDYTFLNKNLSL